VSELRGNSAVVLLFGQIRRPPAGKTRNPSVATSSVLVNMTRVDSKWLITKFQPVFYTRFYALSLPWLCDEGAA